MPKFISVYGTLRRGGPANGMMRGAKYIGKDTIPADLYKLGWFPGVKLNDNGKTIVDVYELPEKNVEAFLAPIDEYEGYHRGAPEQSLFDRQTALLQGRNEETMVYVYKAPLNESLRVKSGDWFSAEI